jgi:hypothetical protein
MNAEILIPIILALVNQVAEMSTNWNNPDYQPPSADSLRALAKQLEELPDLPT